MSNTTLAYYKVKSLASILNSRYRYSDGIRQPASPFVRAPSGSTLRSIALRLSLTALILLLAGLAQAQRPAAATHIVQPGETLGLIAQSYGIDIGALASANGIGNAHLIHSWQRLTIPGAAAQQSASVAQSTHVVQYGETLGTIAAAYGVSLYELQAANNAWGWLIYAGQELAIPAGGTAIAAPEEAAQPDAPPTLVELRSPLESSGMTHTVRFGETLGLIARDYGVSLYDLQALNEIWTWLIYAGQELEIPAGGTAPAALLETASPDESLTPHEPSPPLASSGTTHKVRFGETLGLIARDYGVSLYDLQALNEIWTWVIYVGQELEIPAGGTAPSAPEETASPDESPTPVEPSTHTVKPGENLFRIAERYGLSVDALVRANGITDVTRLHSGLVLRVSNLETAAPPSEAPSQKPAPPAQPPVNDANRERYTVQRGEFLSQIGAQFGMSWLAIAEVNGLRDPDNLKVGTVLLIPTAEEAARYGPVHPHLQRSGGACRRRPRVRRRAKYTDGLRL